MAKKIPLKILDGAERSNVALTLIDINLLAETITRYYDHFSVEGKMLLPLKKVYIPA